MGRAPCCDKANVKRGPWSPEEDAILRSFVEKYGTGGNWIALPRKAGLKRCGKSCRLRWLNYLRPDIKHGGFSDEEDNIICRLYASIGSRWSIIAAQLPGRTDNDIKNYWNTKLKKKILAKDQQKDVSEREKDFVKIEERPKATTDASSALPSYAQMMDNASCSSDTSNSIGRQMQPEYSSFTSMLMKVHHNGEDCSTDVPDNLYRSPMGMNNNSVKEEAMEAEVPYWETGNYQSLLLEALKDDDSKNNNSSSSSNSSSSFSYGYNISNNNQFLYSARQEVPSYPETGGSAAPATSLVSAFAASPLVIDATNMTMFGSNANFIDMNKQSNANFTDMNKQLELQLLLQNGARPSFDNNVYCV